MIGLALQIGRAASLKQTWRLKETDMEMGKSDFDPYHRWLGIPPTAQPPNFYRLLGIELFEDDLEVIEMAYNRQMAYMRGYASGSHGEAASKILGELAFARLCLLSPPQKSAYDENLRADMRLGSGMHTKSQSDEDQSFASNVRGEVGERLATAQRKPSTNWTTVFRGSSFLIIALLIAAIFVKSNQHPQTNSVSEDLPRVESTSVSVVPERTAPKPPLSTTQAGEVVRIEPPKSVTRTIDMQRPSTTATPSTTQAAEVLQGEQPKTVIRTIDLLSEYEIGRWRDVASKGKWTKVEGVYRIDPTFGAGTDFAFVYPLKGKKNFTVTMTFRMNEQGAIKLAFDYEAEINRGVGIRLAYAWDAGFTAGELVFGGKNRAVRPMKKLSDGYHKLFVKVQEDTMTATLDGDGSEVSWKGAFNRPVLMLAGDGFSDFLIKDFELRFEDGQ